MKAEHSQLIPQKHTENLVLLTVQWNCIELIQSYDLPMHCSIRWLSWGENLLRFANCLRGGIWALKRHIMTFENNIQ